MPKFLSNNKNKPKLSFKGWYKNIQLKNIILDNFTLEIATPKDLSPIANYSLFFMLNTVDKILSANFYDWYTDKNYITYIIAETDKIYLQCKIDIKINLFIIFSMFFQTIKIYRRKNGSD